MIIIIYCFFYENHQLGFNRNLTNTDNEISHLLKKQKPRHFAGGTSRGRFDLGNYSRRWLWLLFES